MKIDPAKFIDVCRRWGQKLAGLAEGLDGATFLYALGRVESSDGQNFSPRHEIEYCPQAHVHTHPDPAGGADQVLVRPGRYSSSLGQRKLHALYGCLACASFTPWQIMAANAAPYSPLDILADVEKGAEAVVAHINRLAHNHPGATLEYWAHLWNGQPSAKYVADLLHAYQAGIPELAE